MDSQNSGQPEFAVLVTHMQQSYDLLIKTIEAVATHIYDTKQVICELSKKQQ